MSNTAHKTFISSHSVCSTSNTSPELTRGSPGHAGRQRRWASTLKVCQGDGRPQLPRTVLPWGHHPGHLLWPRMNPQHQRQHHTGEDVFLRSVKKYPPLPERNAGFREAPPHLAGTPNRPQGSSLSEAVWASEAAKTSLCCINREIHILKCLLSQQSHQINANWWDQLSPMLILEGSRLTHHTQLLLTRTFTEDLV